MLRRDEGESEGPLYGGGGVVVLWVYEWVCVSPGREKEKEKGLRERAERE